MILSISKQRPHLPESRAQYISINVSKQASQQAETQASQAGVPYKCKVLMEALSSMIILLFLYTTAVPVLAL